MKKEGEEAQKPQENSDTNLVISEIQSKKGGSLVNQNSSIYSLDNSGAIGVTDKLVDVFNAKEDRSVGNISCSTLSTFMKALGGYKVIFLLPPFLLLAHILAMYSNKFLEDWSRDFKHSDKISSLKTYASIWVAISVSRSIFYLIKVYYIYSMSTMIHNKMLFSVLHSKLQRFLNKVPYGQIQNRFSQDIQAIDRYAVNRFCWFLNPFSDCLINLLTICYTVGWQIAIFIVVWSIVIYRLDRWYMNAKREYERLRAISGSPVITTTSDVIKGLASIRIMNLRQFFRDQYLSRVDLKLRNNFLGEVFTNWFSIRCEITQLLLIQLPAILSMLYLYDNSDPAKVGLFFVCLFQIGNIMMEAISHKTQWEASLVTVERCEHFTKLEAETGYKSYKQESKEFSSGGGRRIKKLIKREKLKYEQLAEPEKFKTRDLVLHRIVTEGRVQFEHMSSRYVNAEHNVLHNLNFLIQPGEKIGIVGRSGSGKSSLIRLLWGYMRPRKGRILIDGKDITKIDVKSLRAQISVITQETALFEGTLRDNLDPTGFRFSDERLIQVLTELDFQNQGYKEKGLEMSLDSQGTNLSQGEKQLVCFARSVMNPSKLILLDEATASIDIKTEETIQRVIKEKFSESTMIIVAHRVQTVLECDRILVMNDGRVDDFDKPKNLMKENQFFKDIVEKMQGH